MAKKRACKTPLWRKTNDTCPSCEDGFLIYNTVGDFYKCVTCKKVYKEWNE